MLRSLTACFSCHRSAQNSVEHAEMVTGRRSSEGLGQTLTYAGNTVVSAATDTPIPTQPRDAASRPVGRYEGKIGVSSNTLAYQTSCLRPDCLDILLASFRPRNEQDAQEHFLNVVSIVSTWSPRWQGKGWPVVAQYCLKSLSPDNLTAACRVLVDASNALSHASRETVLRSIIDRVKYAPGAVQCDILRMLLEAKSLQNLESRNVMMYEFIQNFHFDKLPNTALASVCSGLLDVGDNLCQDIQEHIARNVIYVIKTVPVSSRDKIMIRLMEQSRLQSPEAREYLLDQLSLEIYHLPLDRIIPALVVMLEQLSLLPQPKQKPVMKELCYQLQYMKLGEILPEVVKILNTFANRRQA